MLNIKGIPPKSYVPLVEEVKRLGKGGMRRVLPCRRSKSDAPIDRLIIFMTSPTASSTSGAIPG